MVGVASINYYMSVVKTRIRLAFALKCLQYLHLLLEKNYLADSSSNRSVCVRVETIGAA